MWSLCEVPGAATEHLSLLLSWLLESKMCVVQALASFVYLSHSTNGLKFKEQWLFKKCHLMLSGSKSPSILLSSHPLHHSLTHASLAFHKYILSAYKNMLSAKCINTIAISAKYESQCSLGAQYSTGTMLSIMHGLLLHIMLQIPMILSSPSYIFKKKPELYHLKWYMQLKSCS